MARSETFRLNERIYSRESIEQAIVDFKTVCDIERSGDGLILTPIAEHDAKHLKDEFCNYVLGLMKNG
jgi:hypothetical protein